MAVSAGLLMWVVIAPRSGNHAQGSLAHDSDDLHWPEAAWAALNAIRPAPPISPIGNTWLRKLRKLREPGDQCYQGA